MCRMKRKSTPLGNQWIEVHHRDGHGFRHPAESVTRDRSSFHPDRSGHVHRQGWGLIPVNLPNTSKRERPSHRKVLGDALHYCPQKGNKMAIALTT